MSTVKITPNKETGALVTAYQGNAEFGYVQLTSTELTIGLNAFMQETVKSTLLKGKISHLNSFIKANPSLDIPGKLVVQEYAANAIPASVQANFFNKNLSFAENVKLYAKKAGNDGDVLTHQGDTIVRFTVYDATGKEVDNLLQHDVVPVRASVKDAMLPNGEFEN
jgi:hypothetical protein